MIQAIPIGDHSFIVSDLHLAEGNLDRGRTLGTENFFSDTEFSELLQHLQQRFNESGGTPLCLIINGDFIDYIRITLIPHSKENFSDWQKEIHKVQPHFSIPPNCVSSKEKKYGLKTNNYKCIWKLMCCMQGHAAFFHALSVWVGAGNQIIINVGNHDPEWYWSWLQDYFKFRIWEIHGAHINLRSVFETNIVFSIKAFSIYDKVWIDHGHNYEKMTSIDPDYEYNLVAPKHRFFNKKEALRVINPSEKELFIPFGSFFNRYLINKVELDFPFVDNLTVKGSMINALIDENFKKVWNIIKSYGGYAYYVVQKNFQESFLRAFFWIVFVFIPLVLFVVLYIELPTNFIENRDTNSVTSGVIIKYVNIGLKGLLNILIPIAFRLFFKKLFFWLKLSDPPLSESALKDIGKGGSLSAFDYIVVGHNHYPQHIVQDGKEYINSGTWTSKYVQKYERIEIGITYNVVHISLDGQRKINAELLEWDAPNRELIPFNNFIPNHAI
ncbi:MAG: hypothetical protein IPM92_14345 [Saprospiraceae bacterium]|nr:hypothetical protein [Saprospiraceae bacterium]